MPNDDPQTDPACALSYLQSQAQAYGGRAAVLGKGPSFAEFDSAAARADRFVIGLNETALQAPCHAAFIIDADILERSAPAIAASGIDALITPQRPHHQTKRVGALTIYGPGPYDATSAPWHATFGARHRLFNLSTAAPVPSLGPAFQAFNFSAPTLANLLGQAGFHDILLAGIDGGTAYSQDFKDLEYKKLRSVQNDFDAQFAELRLVRDRHGVKFRSARCQDSFVLIGTEPEQVLATEVLKWSIESRTFLTIRYCEAGAVARNLYSTGGAGTPFSFQRIFLPEMAGHVGRGLYFDSDMLVFKDVYALFNQDMAGNVLMGCQPTPGRRTQFSVFLVDNAAARWDGHALLADYQAGRVTYDALMKEFSFAAPRTSSLPMEWNSLELFDAGRTANIHFTDMGTQPWLSIYNPNAELWCEALFQAMAERPAVAAALELSLAQGWVRPSLRWQVEQQRANPWAMPAQVKALDKAWLPPHVRLRFAAEPPRSQLLKWRVASRVRRAMQSRSYIRLLRAGQALRKVF